MHQLGLPDIKTVNINHQQSRKTAVSEYFRRECKNRSFILFLFSVITFGIYPYQKHKHAKHMVSQAIAARKLMYFKALQSRIEKIRQDQSSQDPRQALNAVFMSIRSEKLSEHEESVEFKAIYYPQELLLFITNPIRNYKSVRLHTYNSKVQLEYLKMWRALKKQSHVNQYRQIQNINYYNRILKQQYCLTPSGIHDRLMRSSIGLKNTYLITKFRELSRAFQEILIAYQDLDELKESKFSYYQLIETLSKTSQKDIKILHTYLSDKEVPKELPLENRRQLIQLSNQQDILYRMSEEKIFETCSLVLNQYQWDFLLSLQKVSQVTINLIDWAFKECPVSSQKDIGFLKKISINIDKYVINQSKKFPIIYKQIMDDKRFHVMTTSFASELHREWPKILMYRGDTVFFEQPMTESIDLKALSVIYLHLQQLANDDDQLFAFLQQSLSQLGKNAFHNAIEEGVLELLGEKSQHFLPILSNTSIKIIYKTNTSVDLEYVFEQVITSHGDIKNIHKDNHMVINQPLLKEGNQWTAPNPSKHIIAKEENL